MSVTEQPTGATAPARLAVPVVFTATIFLSASLLFFVQPLFAKLILPKIGGAPAVWTTAMLFFQTVLIAGYLYAHLLIRHVPAKAQMVVHLALWAAALLFLPLSVSEGWIYDPSRSTALQTLILLAIGVGVPFATLSANAPLLQAWYARSGGPSAHDPYFLYGASNVGSLLALLAFPLLAEPVFGASAIGLGWAAGFVLLGAGLLTCGLAVRQPAFTGATTEDAPAPAFREIALWLFIAFVPSSLMLAVTTEISTDLGSFPLVWVIPLAIYILSFVVTFTTRELPANWTRTAALISIAVMGLLVANLSNTVPSWLKAILFAPTLLAIAVEAHRSLYARRPHAKHLTLFYITMSVGGALGGLANSILAPWIFAGVHEGLVTVLLAAALLMLLAGRPDMRAWKAAILAASAALVLLYTYAGIIPIPLPVPVILALIAATVFAASLRHPVAIALPLVLVLFLDGLALQKSYLFKDRSFFGAHAVREEDGIRIYTNGTTVHGLQFAEETGRPTPLSYYHPTGPMARIVTSDFGAQAQDIGIVGLGVGSLACYAQPHQTWQFYEIDAMVDHVARDPSLFTFLSECTPDAPTHLGDARVVLATQDVTYDILVLDAYSSDAIPVHLVTEEALELYLDRLKPGGVLVFHISNRYYDVSAPLARIGASKGLTMAIEDYAPDKDDPALEGASHSVVVAMSKDPAKIAALPGEGWQPLTSDHGPLWTDDYANLLSALR